MTIERRVRIVQEEGDFNPRKEYDCHVGRMLCWHRNYNLGDEHNYGSDTWKQELACEVDTNLEDKIEFLENESYTEWFDQAQEEGDNDPHAYASHKCEEAIRGLVDSAFEAGYIALPLTLHDHGSISMTTGYGGCGWDSGCVGVIVCTKEKARGEYGESWLNTKKYLCAEVETYDHYLRGNVWGYVCEERDNSGCNTCGTPNSWDDVDSCWGFVGEYEDMKSEVPVEFTDCFDSAEVEYL